MSAELESCPGCGALVPETDGPTHRYLGASPGCWAVFGEVLAREYSDQRYWPVHQLTVDAYAVQHPGQTSPQTIQSVAVHLISLYLVLEEGRTVDEAGKAMHWATTQKHHFRWLEPPASRGNITILDVREATSPAEHAELVEAWARSAWDTWSDHHETVRRWGAAAR